MRFGVVGLALVGLYGGLFWSSFLAAELLIPFGGTPHSDMLVVGGLGFLLYAPMLACCWSWWSSRHRRVLLLATSGLALILSFGSGGALVLLILFPTVVALLLLAALPVPRRDT